MFAQLERRKWPTSCYEALGGQGTEGMPDAKLNCVFSPAGGSFSDTATLAGTLRHDGLGFTWTCRQAADGRQKKGNR